MTHLILLFYIISFASGTGALALIYQAAKRSEHPVWKSFFHFYIGITFTMFAVSYRSYAYIFTPASVGEALEIYPILILGYVSIIYTFPKWILLSLNDPLEKKASRFFLGLCLIILVLRELPYTFIFQPELAMTLKVMSYNFHQIVWVSLLAFAVWRSTARYEAITELWVRNLFKNFLMIMFGYLPFMLLDIITGAHQSALTGSGFFSNRGISVNFTVLPFAYIAWNILIIRVLSTFERKKANINIQDNVKSFCTHFQLTPRETELLSELLSGKTNAEISEKLTISLPTVKTHVNRILSKTFCKNRVELFNRVWGEWS